eukprot:1182229-Prorocentrum_minimum.AAC.1
MVAPYQHRRSPPCRLNRLVASIADFWAEATAEVFYGNPFDVFFGGAGRLVLALSWRALYPLDRRVRATVLERDCTVTVPARRCR